MMETIQNHKREFGIGAIILAVLLIFSFYEYHEKKQAELAASQLELNGNVDLRKFPLPSETATASRKSSSMKGIR